MSRASERQRRGRAGRCQPGVAFHCYSRTRSAALAELQLPELKRSPLDELCLQVRSHCLEMWLPRGGGGGGGDVLGWDRELMELKRSPLDEIHLCLQVTCKLFRGAAEGGSG